MSQNKHHVLIVGGAGYIGSIITQNFLECGLSVRCFDNFIYNHTSTVLPFLGHNQYEFKQGDINNTAALSESLEGITDVVLLAGLVGDPITKAYPDASGMINDDGYDRILETLSGHKLNKVVFVSTCSNYGLIEGDHLADEGYELQPLSLYAKSKVRLEKILLSAKGQIDYSPTVLRFATAFGLSPRMRFDLTISEFTRALFLDEDLLVYDADTWRPYCHVRDFADVIHRVLDAPKKDVEFEVFNAGGEINNFTKQMIVDAILEELPCRQVRYQEHGSDPRNYRVSFAKIRKRLNFEPKYTVSHGIRELIAAMKQGFFHDITKPESFHGNWVIDYTIPSKAIHK